MPTQIADAIESTQLNC